MEWFSNMVRAKPKKPQEGKAVSSGCIFPKIIWRAHSVILSRSGPIIGLAELKSGSEGLLGSIWARIWAGISGIGPGNSLFSGVYHWFGRLLGKSGISRKNRKSLGKTGFPGGCPYRPLLAGSRGEMPTGGPGPFFPGTPFS